MSRCEKCKEITLSTHLTANEKQLKYFDCFCNQLLLSAKVRNNEMLLNFVISIRATYNLTPQ